MPSPPALSAPRTVLAILGGLVEERLGLHYREADLPLFADKATARALDAGFDSLLDYYYFLRYNDPDGHEFDALADALLVHETYLFRELSPLEVLCDEIVAPILRAGRRARLWSAACATGEEPYTLAMTLARRVLLEGTEIVASDVSRRVLDIAERGELPMRSLRGPLDPAYAPWLAVRDGRLHVDPTIRASVLFRAINLFDEGAVAALGTFDAILCRNVLIYFEDDRARDVVERLSRRLAIGGALFVSVTESLMRLQSGLECQERRGVFLYRRRA